MAFDPAHILASAAGIQATSAPRFTRPVPVTFAKRIPGNPVNGGDIGWESRSQVMAIIAWLSLMYYQQDWKFEIVLEIRPDDPGPGF